MKKIFYILSAALMAFTISSCDLEEQPVSSIGRDAIFGNETGLQLYVNGLYSTPSTVGYRQGKSSYDGFLCYSGYQNYFDESYDGRAQGGNWYYSTIRACNYFLEHNNYDEVSEKVRNNFNGIVRYIRAQGYRSMIETYSEVPLVDHVLDVNEDDILYGPKNSRDEVAEFAYEDYKYAYENITLEKDNYCSVYTKSVVAMQWAKFCLLEASWRKYHPTLLGLSSSADKWYQRAVDAAELLINSGKYSLYSNFHDLFFQTDPTKIASEVLMADTYGSKINVYHMSTALYTSATLGGGWDCFSRYLVNMFLNADGTSFTDNPDYKTMTFQEETKNRDPRLAYTFRTPGYTRNSGALHVNPDFSNNFTGYTLRKFVSDNTYYDTNYTESTCYIRMRYAELLLIWAEAKAELGTLTDADWAKSVGAIRKRAGITGGSAETGTLTTKPTVADPYLLTIFTTTTDPTVLEIRRERFVEFVGEQGQEWQDIRRWREGQILNLYQEGIYIDKFNEPLDLDEDGNYDTYFYTGTKPTNTISGVYYCQVDNDPSDGWQCIRGVMDDGHTLRYNVTNKPRVFMDRCYLSPIGNTTLTINPQITQTPGWE